MEESRILQLGELRSQRVKKLSTPQLLNFSTPRLREAAMKVPIDKLDIIVRQDGLVLTMYPLGAALEQLLPQSTALGVLRQLVEERQAERAPHGKVQ